MWLFSRRRGEAREEHFQGPYLDVDIYHRAEDKLDLVRVGGRISDNNKICLPKCISEHTSPNRGLILDFGQLEDSDSFVASHLINVYQGRRRGFCVSGLTERARNYVAMVGERFKGIWKITDVHFLRDVDRAVDYFKGRRRALYQ